VKMGVALTVLLADIPSPSTRVRSLENRYPSIMASCLELIFNIKPRIRPYSGKRSSFSSSILVSQPMRFQVTQLKRVAACSIRITSCLHQQTFRVDYLKQGDLRPSFEM
jgi:hypothetical protein